MSALQAEPGFLRPTTSVALDVRNRVLLLALEHLADAAGYDRVKNPGPDAVRVVDQIPPAPTTADVLVTQTSPLAGRIALGALVDGVVEAVVQMEEPDTLPVAIEALQRGAATVPSALVQSARELPPLDARQHQVMGCVSAGSLQDAAMADELHVSAATVKRDVQQLMRLMDATNRQELATCARHLGYQGRLRPCELSLL